MTFLIQILVNIRKRRFSGVIRQKDIYTSHDKNAINIHTNNERQKIQDSLTKVDRTDAINSNLVTNTDRSDSILKDPLYNTCDKSKPLSKTKITKKSSINISKSNNVSRVYNGESPDVETHTTNTSSDNLIFNEDNPLTKDKPSIDTMKKTKQANLVINGITIKDIAIHSVIGLTKDSEELHDIDSIYENTNLTKSGYHFVQKVLNHSGDTKGLGTLTKKKYQITKNSRELQKASQVMHNQKISRAIMQRNSTKAAEISAIRNTAIRSKIAGNAASSITISSTSSGAISTGIGSVIGLILLIIIAIVLIFIIIVGIIGAVSDQTKTGNLESLEGNEKIVALYLLDKGLDPLHVAAIMGNIEAESSFNPGLIEEWHIDAGDGFGLCQWSFGRRKQLEQYTLSKGMPANDINIQLDFLWAELTGTGDATSFTSIQYNHSGFLAINNLEDAVYYYGRNFERMNEAYAHWDRRISSAQRYYSALIDTSGIGGLNGVIAIADAQLGKPYVWGAAGPDAFDCSGLVYYCYYHAGVYTGERTTAEGYRKIATPITKEQAIPGDLVFWIPNGGVAEHIAIYVGDGRVIQAPQTGDVVKYSNIWYEDNISVIFGRMPVK